MRNLRTVRTSFHLSEMELANAAEVNFQTIQNIESQRTTMPRPDVRRRLEIALGQRIDWVKTAGLKRRPDRISWEEAELNLRNAIQSISGLQKGEQVGMIQVAHNYILSIDEMLLPKEVIDSNPVPVHESETISLTRKRFNQTNK